MLSRLLLDNFNYRIGVFVSPAQMTVSGIFYEFVTHAKRDTRAEIFIRLIMSMLY